MMISFRREALFETMAILLLSIPLATPVLAVERQVVRGHVPRPVARLNLLPLNRLPATNHLDLLIGLPPRDAKTLTNLLEQLYDPLSPCFHHWLTPDQIAQQFGPIEEDYQAVIACVKNNGLTVTTTHADRTLLRVEGPVADIERMFHVTMLLYQHPTEPRTFYAPDVEPSLDLSVPVLHISGLDNFHIPRPGSVTGTPSVRRPLVGRGQMGSSGDMTFAMPMCQVLH